MNSLALVLKRTLFYPTFLMLSSGFFLAEWRGFVPLATAAGIALAIHIGVNSYELWKSGHKRTRNSS